MDTFDGAAFISIVALTEAGIVPSPPGVPLWAFNLLSLSHHAVNVRTYVRPSTGAEAPAGIFFFTLDCSSILPTIGAWALFALPYRWAAMTRSRHHGGDSSSKSAKLESRRWTQKATFSAEWVAEEETSDLLLARFLVERYTLYNEPGPLMRLLGAVRCHAQLWSGQITHEPWPLQTAQLLSLNSSVIEAAGLDQLVASDAKPAAVHCSKGVGPIDFFWRGES